jgi:hypothetical protein
LRAPAEVAPVPSLSTRTLIVVFFGYPHCCNANSRCSSTQLPSGLNRWAKLQNNAQVVMANSFTEARKRQLARLGGANPPAPRAAMALAKSQAYQDAADAPVTLPDMS